MKTTRILAQIESGNVPGPVEYKLITPAGLKDGLPLVLELRAGAADAESLTGGEQRWRRWWKKGLIPEAMVLTPSIPRYCLGMNLQDGTERWEDFLVKELLPYVCRIYGIDASKVLINGRSMGGTAALRIALRYPGRFRAVAAVQPTLEPVAEWHEVRRKHHYWRDQDQLERVLGSPVDAGHWRDNHPAAIATANRDKIRRSKLQIYFEAGDKDQLWTYEGAEYLHQVLWNERIRHEYHLVRGAEHFGQSLRQRVKESVRFLFRSLEPWPPPPEKFQPVINQTRRWRAELDEVDHYNQP